MKKGDEIKAKRKAMGWSAQQLAQFLGVEVSNLYKWEKGHNPSKPEDFLKIEGWLKNTVAPPTSKQIGKNSNNEKFLNGDINLTAQEYVNELRKDKARLEQLLENNQRIIDTNLTAMMTLLSALHRHDLAFHEETLESLARIEKKKNHRALVEAANKREAAMMAEEQVKGSFDAVGR